jgi:hypothetical protein
MEGRLGKGAHELLDEGEGAASEREYGTEEHVGTECRDIRVFVEAKIHPGRVRTGRDAVKEWRPADDAANPRRMAAGPKRLQSLQSAK